MKYGSILITVATVIVVAAVPSALHAQQSRPKSVVSAPARLRARAKITEQVASATALAQVPNGRIKSGELEEEGGKLIWSFDLAVPGKSGIEEVAVDAESGKVVAHEHESPAAERREKAQEAREKKKP